MKRAIYAAILCATVSFVACSTTSEPAADPAAEVAAKVEAFKLVDLTTSIDHLTDAEKEMLPILYKVATIMDDIFWMQAYGDKEELLSSLPNEEYRDFARINYGPWERLNGNAPFAPGFEAKPKGAGFYPADMTLEEFQACDDPAKESMYTLLRRDESGRLFVLPYREAYAAQIAQAADLLDQAAELAEDAGLKRYLSLRATALRTDDYQPSDMAWMDMKTNRLDFVVGPIENYEDHLFGTKAAHEAFVLVKDMEWSERLGHYATLLPTLQKGLPVEDKYKAEMPGTDSDLGVYDALYYGGDCNAGSKTIAINLPNDPEVHLAKGSRKLQLKNSMKYKFDYIVTPIAGLLMDPAQQSNVTFKAFFENTMFHEVAHGLGIKNTLDGNSTVREALAETYSAIEECKADILGIYMVEQLAKMGELPEHNIMDNYVTFMAGIFRSVRFGAASAHGKANMMSFHYFEEFGAFVRNAEAGYYSVVPEKMSEAVASLAREILVMQGDGNYEAVKAMLQEKGVVDEALQKDLNRINENNIPIDIRFNQGPALVGLTPIE